MSEQFIIALSTFPDSDTASKIARELVDSALVACVNILSPVQSIYFWRDTVEETSEVLGIFKLTSTRYSEFEERLHSLHPYDVPEILRIDVAGGSPEYLRWVGESCSRA